jgi:hypothetical protein
LRKLLDHVIVRLRPVPTRFQLPAVHDVADEINHVGIIEAQKIEQLFGLAAPGAEVDV